MTMVSSDVESECRNRSSSSISSSKIGAIRRTESGDAVGMSGSQESAKAGNCKCYSADEGAQSAHSSCSLSVGRRPLLAKPAIRRCRQPWVLQECPSASGRRRSGSRRGGGGGRGFGDGVVLFHQCLEARVAAQRQPKRIDAEVVAGGPEAGAELRQLFHHVGGSGPAPRHCF